MARQDTGAGSGSDELASATVSITPIPIDDVIATIEDADASTRTSTKKQATSSIKTATRPKKKSKQPRPSRHVAKYLFGTERFVGEWRRHWIHVLGWSALAILSPFIAGYLIGILGQKNPAAVWLTLGGWLLLLAFLAWQLIDWWHERFVLTDRRVMLVTGLLTRRVAMMPLARVTDMAYEQSIPGMILNYGKFIIESAGQDQALREVTPLPNPNGLYLRFCQEMYDPGAISKEADENAPEHDYDGAD